PESGVHAQVRAVAFIRDRSLLSFGSEGMLRAWEGPQLRPAGSWRMVGPGERIAGAAFSGDGRRLAFARLDRGIEVWDTAPCRRRWCFRSPDAETFGFGQLSLSRDGTTLAIAPCLGRIAVWELAS